MITLRQLLIGVGVLIGLSYLLVSLRSPAAKPAPVTVAAREPLPDVAARTEQGIAEKAQVTERLKKLELAQVRQDQRQVAAEQLPARRQRLLDAHYSEWGDLIRRHWTQYQNLHAAAGRNPTLETPCTICDDSFLKFCLICDSHNNGKCPECHGTGHLLGGDICPACSATGLCFMCAGTGKMPCPFCDQRGMIYYDRPPPSFVPVPL